MPQSEHTLKGFAARLVDSGLLEPQAAQLAEQEANEAGESLLLHIIAHGLVTARDATLAAAWEYGLPYVDLDALRIDSLPSIDELPEKVLRKLGVLPLYRREHRLTVGVPSPSTLTHLDELQFATGLSIESVLVAADQLTPALEQYLEAGEESAMDMLSEDGEALDGLDFEGEEDNNNDLAITASSDDAPVVRFVHKVLLDAIKRGASDIHFEPYESTYRIRFRIDGMLIENTRPPFNMRNR
ncbi:ATPase, T2SS/T4P/T4SS family, partial [uncultured Cobetia sp.]|uniref:ATPase, T2SS/T4P/T4SS family n=1 Tax=uncultured Cobetia sp. TaxID=410706 RepID=UPI0032B2496F